MLHFFPRKKPRSVKPHMNLGRGRLGPLSYKKLFKIMFPDCVSINMDISKVAKFNF